MEFKTEIKASKFKKENIVGLINSPDQSSYIILAKYLVNNKYSYECALLDDFLSGKKFGMYTFSESQLGLIEDMEQGEFPMDMTNMILDLKPAILFPTDGAKVDPNHKLHMDLILQMHETYLVKNKDYGNSFSEQYDEYGVLSAIIRFDDKIRRIKQLMRNGKAEVNDESLKDSVKDLANYAVMLWMELEKDERNNIK